MRPNNPDGYIEIDVPEGGIRIGLSDLIVTHAERDRFEAAHGLNGNKPMESEPRPGPGALPVHDWDGFWIAVYRQMHDNGWPATQAAMVRTLLDWLETNAGQAPTRARSEKRLRACGDRASVRADP